jgi:cytochrome c peroxidase
MKKSLLPHRAGLVAVALLTGLCSGVAQTPLLDPVALRTNALARLSPLPDKAPGAERDTAVLVDLGKRLYFEKRLSKNGAQSCNTCHAVDGGRAGVDNEPTSPGAFGKRGDRNSPTTFNAALHIAQFWDGRAADLKEQAKGPILNPVEMAMSSEPEVIARLNADKEYPQLFKAAFAGEKSPVSYENVARAIAAFERTLITRDRLDDFLKGSNDALTRAELRGLHTFLSVGCVSCHDGPLLGGGTYQKMGLLKPYENQKDIGRAAVTKDDDDKFKFKVPTLRNIAVTHPYFHDGKVASLHEAVRKMADLQLGMTLTQEQEAHLVSFLRALTGKSLNGAATAGQSAVQHMTVDDAQKLLADKKVVVLDIRTPEEFRAGHIHGATNINFRAAEFDRQIAALPKDTAYLLHCASGNRSTQALPVFQKYEFKKLMHLDGGIKAWEKAGLPVAK